MSDEKLPLDLRQLAEDLSLSNEEGTGWYDYGEPQNDFIGDYLPVEEYGDEGDVVARYKMRVTFERTAS
jgi:hypothetical protein